jgi:hypothetical protein
MNGVASHMFRPTIVAFFREVFIKQYIYISVFALIGSVSHNESSRSQESFKIHLKET